MSSMNGLDRCPACGRGVKLHPNGKLYRHTANGEICRGSGMIPGRVRLIRRPVPASGDRARDLIQRRIAELEQFIMLEESPRGRRDLTAKIAGLRDALAILAIVGREDRVVDETA